MRLLKKLNSTIDRFVDGMAWIAGILLLFMIFSICCEVLMRYFFNKPLTWTVEITEYILLYITFLGAPWLLKEEGHVRVDVLLSRLRLHTQMILNIITSILGALICFTLFCFGVQSTLDHFIRKVPVIKALEVPKFILLAIIPFGCFFLAIQFLRQFHNFRMNLRKRIQQERKEFKTGL